MPTVPDPRPHGTGPATHDPATITAVVVNYNTGRLVAAAVRSALVDGAAHAVVIDNASPRPGEWQTLCDELGDDRRVALHARTHNDGFGAGVNAGVALVPTATTHVLLLNPDAELCPGALRRMLTTLGDAHGPAIVAPRIASSDGALWSDGGVLDLMRGTTRRMHEGRRAGVTVETFLPGAILLIPRAVLRTVGPLREDLFMYWEDADYCRRATALGVSLLLDHEAAAVHDAGASSSAQPGAQKSALWHYYMNRNRLVVCREQGTTARQLLLGPGRRATRSLIATAARSGTPLTSLTAATRGVVAGWRHDVRRHPVAHA